MALLDFQGNELRVLVRAERDASAGAAFEAIVGLPRRLPARYYEVQVIDEGGVLRAAGALDHRGASARATEEEARAPPSSSASAGARAGKRKI